MTSFTLFVRFFVFLFFSAVLFSQAGLAQAEDKKIFLFSVVQKDSDYYGRLVRMIYMEAFKRINLSAEIKYLPIRRSNLMVMRGKVDGDLARSEWLRHELPHLIKVREPAFKVNIVAYSSSPTIKVDNWQALADKMFRVDYLAGSSYMENKILQGNVPEHFTSVPSWTIGLRKLFADRSDIFVEFEGGVRYAMTRSEFQGKKIFVAGVIDTFGVYAFLQPQHANIADLLSRTLSEMKSEGLIEEYARQAFSGGFASNIILD